MSAISSSFLLRYADRQFLASFLQLPPRFTRLVAYGHGPGVVLAHRDGNAKISRRRSGKKQPEPCPAAAVPISDRNRCHDVFNMAKNSSLRLRI